MSFVINSDNAISIAISLKDSKITPEIINVVVVANSHQEIVLVINSVFELACFPKYFIQALS